MSGRIDEVFARWRAAGRTGVIPFVTAGYPSLDVTEAVIPKLEQAAGTHGAILEIGIPFSDPIADGPVIADSMHRALAGGATPQAVFELVGRLRPRSEAALVAMVSVSIVEAMGAARFMADAAEAGFDGLIVPDLDAGAGCDDPADALATLAGRHGLSFTLLIAPTTPAPRIERLAGRCSGFVYVLARAGITGERDALPDVAGPVKAVRAVTGLPVAVGFGIGRPEQVAAATASADAAVVGSAVVRRLEHGAEAAAELVRTLAAAAARRDGGPDS